jgi:hypothetical protein
LSVNSRLGLGLDLGLDFGLGFGHRLRQQLHMPQSLQWGMLCCGVLQEFDSIERAQALIDAPGACQLYLTDSTYPITLQYSHSVRRGGRDSEHHHGAPAAAMPVLAVSNLDLGVT